MYMARFREVLEHDRSLRVVMVTLTLPNGPDLRERLGLLLGAWRTMVGRVRRARSGGRNRSALSCCMGGVASAEVKRGSGSGLWHPHLHALVITRGPIDLGALRSEWGGITAGSNIDAQWVRAGSGLYRDIAEVLKYASKLCSMEAGDTVHAWGVCRGQRLLASFGCLRGLDVEPERVPDSDKGAVLLALDRARGVYRIAAMGLPSERPQSPF
jgi:hypothetical protein